MAKARLHSHNSAQAAKAAAPTTEANVTAETPAVRQLAGNMAHKAVSASAVELLDDYFKKIDLDMAELQRLYEDKKGVTKEARALENSINTNARQAGSIMVIFADDLPREYSVAWMNQKIEDGAKAVYGPEESKNHVYYKDISAVHDIREHLSTEVHKIHGDISSGTINPDDVGAILERVENRLGDTLTSSLAAMGVESAAMEDMLRRIALSAAERDFIGATGNATPATVRVTQVAEELPDTLEMPVTTRMASDTSYLDSEGRKYLSEADQLRALAKISAGSSSEPSMYDRAADNLELAALNRQDREYYLVITAEVCEEAGAKPSTVIHYYQEALKNTSDAGEQEMIRERINAVKEGETKNSNEAETEPSG